MTTMRVMTMRSTLFKTLGKVVKGEGSAAAGRAVVLETLSGWGVPADALEAACDDLLGVALAGLGTTSIPPAPSGEVMTSADCDAGGEASHISQWSGLGRKSPVMASPAASPTTCWASRASTPSDTTC